MGIFKESKDKTTLILISLFVLLTVAAIALGLKSLDLVQSNAKIVPPAVLVDQKLLDPIPMDSLKSMTDPSEAMRAQDFIEEKGVWGSSKLGMQLIREVDHLVKNKKWTEVISKANEAIAALEAQDKASPGNATKFYVGWAYGYRAQAYCHFKQYDKALEDANKSIAVRPRERPDGYSIRAAIYKCLGKEELAKADLRKASKLRHATD